MRFKDRLTFANVAAASALFIAIGGGAFAVGAIPGPNGEIAACFKKRGPAKGQVRLLLAGGCKRTEVAITWNVQGQQGVPGVAGADGQAGPAGADGTDGADGANASPDTPAQILAKLLTVDDDPGTTLNADRLDGQEAAAFLEAGDNYLGGSDLQGTQGTPTIASNAVALGSDTTGSYVQSVGSGTGLQGGVAAAEGVTPTLSFDYSGSATMSGGQTVFRPSGLLFEGSTPDLNELSLVANTVTASRTITLPDVSGTALTTGNLDAITDTGSLADLIVTGNTTLGNSSSDTVTVDAGDTVFTNATSSADSLMLGTVVGGANLYRSAADTLKTDDNLVVDADATLGSAAADTVTVNGGPVALPNATSALDALTLGADTNLFRSAVDTLRTDDSLLVNADLTSNGNTTLGNSATDTITINAGPVNLPNATNAGDGLVFASGADSANLYRSGPNALGTDDSLTVASDADVDGNVVVGSSLANELTVNGYIDLPSGAIAPLPADCTASDIGRMFIQTGATSIWVCVAAGQWASADLTP